MHWRQPQCHAAAVDYRRTETSSQAVPTVLEHAAHSQLALKAIWPLRELQCRAEGSSTQTQDVLAFNGPSRVTVAAWWQVHRKRRWGLRVAVSAVRAPARTLLKHMESERLLA